MGIKVMACGCEFVAVGKPLSNLKCKTDPVVDRKIHNHDYYACGRCNCTDYRPHRAPDSRHDWPACTCGHAAQEHN